MNLTEMCSIIPKNIIRDNDALSIMMSMLQTATKVYPKSKVVFAQNYEQDNLVQNAINYIFEKQGLSPDTLMWMGIYGEKGKKVNFWSFMTGLTVIRGIDGFWGFAGPNLSKKEWKHLMDDLK